MYYGVDVSTHNGKIDWKTLSAEIEFAMLRVGYGKGNIDSEFSYNANECEKYNIPFGGYWFSYALNKDMAKKEAEYCCNIIKNFKISLPIAYDWEYDSDKYAQKQGVKLAIKDIIEFADIFCKTINDNGYSCMIYANTDYLKKGFSALTSKYPLWLADWSTHNPQYKCEMWQYTDRNSYKGIKGNVDANIYYGKIDIENPKIVTIDDIKSTVLSKIPSNWWYDYRDVAVDVIAGKYGNGLVRKEKLRAKGYDATIVQLFVNELVK